MLNFLNNALINFCRNLIQFFSSIFFTEAEFLGAGEGQGRQGGKPFYPPKKVHVDRNLYNKIEQRRLPKPQIFLNTKNHHNAI